ncbi:MAG: hypothetical protein JJLCMIEE_00392 [Acidimicrobiales bacterium]|nr:hypothetical protein [Acidimicrobiales bacterium]
MRALRTLLPPLVIPLVLVGCGDSESPAPADNGDEPKSYGLSDDEIVVGNGDEFLIEIRENPSVGDAWQLIEDPDRAVVEFVDEEFVSDDPEATGAGGETTFTFRATGSGSTTLEMGNCYRCADDQEKYTDTHTFDVTVED